MYGPGTLDEASKRRSIYFTMKRSKLIPMLVIFDAPDGTVGVGERPTTTIAPQALLMMNNPQVRSWAQGLRGQAMIAASATTLGRGSGQRGRYSGRLDAGSATAERSLSRRRRRS